MLSRAASLSLLVVEREADGGLDQADVGAAVEARALEAVGIAPGLLASSAAIASVSWISPPAPGSVASSRSKIAPAQDVAPDHRERARRVVGCGLFDDRA